MATKFSQFNAVGPSGTTEIVGLDGGSNAKFAVNTLNVSNLAGLPLSIANGGSGQTTQALALNALTDSANQTVNNILYINNSNEAAFINPTLLAGVPKSIGLYAEFLDNIAGGTYYNFTNGINTPIAFNAVQGSWSTDSISGGITMNFNGQPGSAGVTTFTVPVSGSYKITLNINFFDQVQGLQIKSNVFNVNTSGQKGLILERCEANVTIAQMYNGIATVNLTANDAIQIYVEFSGGSGTPDPFPNNSSVLYPGGSVLIEYLG